jgi:hypothetical protein
LLVEGAPVYHAIHFSADKDQWYARYAELYSREELDAFFNHTEVEPERVAEFEPVTEAKPPTSLNLKLCWRQLPAKNP